MAPVQILLLLMMTRNMLPPKKWQKTPVKEHLEPNSNGKPAKEFSASRWGEFGCGRPKKEDEALLKVVEQIQRPIAELVWKKNRQALVALRQEKGQMV